MGPDTSLEEFLEELEALCDPEVTRNSPDSETQDTESSMSVETATTTGYVSAHTKPECQLIPTDSSNKNTSISRGAEKKVRFSEDLIQGAFEKNLSTATAEIKATSLKNMPQNKTVLEDQDVQQDFGCDQEGVKNNQEQKSTGILLTDPQAKTQSQLDSQDTSIKELKPTPKSSLNQELPETEGKSEESPCDSVASQNGTEATAFTEQNLFHMMEPLKNNTSRNTGRRQYFICSCHKSDKFLTKVTSTSLTQ